MRSLNSGIEEKGPCNQLKCSSNNGHTKSANLGKRKNYQQKVAFHQANENEISPKSLSGQP